MDKKNQETGFGLIQILVCVAFLGLLASTLVVLLGSLKFKDQDIQKLYDTKRLSDMTDIRTGLDLYLTSAGGYPDNSLWGTGKIIYCGSKAVVVVPHSPGGKPYIYQATGKSSVSTTCDRAKVWSAYNVQFETEGPNSLGSAGVYCLKSDRGILAGPCSK